MACVRYMKSKSSKRQLEKYRPYQVSKTYLLIMGTHGPNWYFLILLDTVSQPRITRCHLPTLSAPNSKQFIPAVVKFIYSKMATSFCKISTVDLSYVVKFIYSEKATNFAKYSPYFCLMQCQSKVVNVKISQNYVAFSEYMNFTT